MLEALLRHRNQDSTENINARLSALVPKGILQGGIVVPEPASLQVRVKGNPGEPVLVAFASDGMMVRERAEEHVLPVQAGITNVICLRARYLDGQPPIAQFEVLPLGTYQSDPEPQTLIRLASVTPEVGATVVSAGEINNSFRDSVEGFVRRIVRGVVDQYADLPAVSGSPAAAEINFLSNNFAVGSTITISTGLVTETFSIVRPISFGLAGPAEPGVSRTNPADVAILTAQQASTGVVTVTTAVSPVPYGNGDYVRISGNSAVLCNGLWQVQLVPGHPEQFTFTGTLPPGVAPFYGTGGTAVDQITPATVTVKLAPGVLHDITVGMQVQITNVTDATFNTIGTVLTTNYAPPTGGTQFTFRQIGYPTGTSGNGLATKVGYSLPVNAIAIGASESQTAANFETVFRASRLAPDILASAIGSSIQMSATQFGEAANAYTLAKTEPTYEPSQYVIVLSGATFRGGTEPIPSLQASADLQTGDLYVVVYGEAGSMEIWGYDGVRFVNLTSSSTASLLDFHRKNILTNEKHLTENEKAALSGTVGVPSSTNRYVTESDTSVLTQQMAAALVGADNPPPPSGDNRFLTEARYRGETASVVIPDGQNHIELPEGERWVVGRATDSALQYVNVVRFSPEAGGWVEYCNEDFTPVRVTAFKTFKPATPLLETTLNPADPDQGADTSGIWPKADAAVLGYDTVLRVYVAPTPNKGDARLLYSLARREKERKPTADQNVMPQRIVPAETTGLIDKVSELRLNAGISAAGHVLSFPADFLSTQQATTPCFRRRAAGAKFNDLTAAFGIDLQTGVSLDPNVETFTPAAFPAPNTWTRYLLTLTRDSTIRVLTISDIMERAADPVFSPTLSAIPLPSVLSREGLYVWGSVAVCSSATYNGTTDRTVRDVDLTTLELYPYMGSNAPGLDLPIVCGDGNESWGHFSGEDALARALQYASPGDTIRLQPGVYDGVEITKPDITIEAESGAALQQPAGTALTIAAARFKGLNLRFRNCNVGIEILAGADDLVLQDPVFESSVVGATHYSCAVPVPGLAQQRATWTVTDGTSTLFVGNFNSPDGIQQAHDAAQEGDEIVLYPGVYQPVVWSKSNLTIRGFGGAAVTIGTGTSGTALTVTGSGNQFSNFVVNKSVGIDCQLGATRNRFDVTVGFGTAVQTPIMMPPTATQRHHNYHPAVSGTDQYATVGDGVRSWGDYCGPDAINTAIAAELDIPNGKIRTLKVKPGIYNPIDPAVSGTWDDFTIEGSGGSTSAETSSILRAVLGFHDYCARIGGSGNRLKGFFCDAVSNDGSIGGFYIDGHDNIVEACLFATSAGSLILPDHRYYVHSGFRNRFVPHSGAPTGYVSWTVGDGNCSFGDFNGSNAIIGAINALPTTPSGDAGELTNPSLDLQQCDFEDTTGSLTFTTDHLHRYLTVRMGSDPNSGNFRIVGILSDHKVRIERQDGGAFACPASDLFWDCLAGAKIWVLPGTYAPFTVARHDLDLEAWGAGSDTVVVGSDIQTPLITVSGNRNRVAGFRLAGGVPSTGVAIRLEGSANVLERNLYETAVRYDIASEATQNRILDTFEDSRRTAFTVSTLPSRADFVGTTEAVLQAACAAAAADPHIKRIEIGAGTYLFSQTVSVPPNVSIHGSGYGTLLVGTPLVDAFTLQDGHQTVTGLRFQTFQYSLTGTATNVFAFGNWLESAPIDLVNLTGNFTLNL